MLKDDARAVRAKYGLTTGRVLPGEMKKILLAEGVDEIVLWEHFKRVRGAYLIEDDKAIVAVRKGLPIDQYAFTLGHEFKHHRHDRHLGGILCSPSTERDPIEIGAEIFSAEFIYPEQLYLEEIWS